MTQDEVDKYCESITPSVGAIKRRKLIYEVGINDLPHIVKIKDAEGSQRAHSGYSHWGAMFQRCFSENLKALNPTYYGIFICEEWKYASNFVAWQKTQHREDGWQLDKDLLVVGNKVYSPDTCVFVPPWLNSFTTDCGRSRGKSPIGCSWDSETNKYRVRCNNPITGKTEYLGRYFDEEVAAITWRIRKLEIAKSLKQLIDEVDVRIYENILTIISEAK